MFYIIRHGKTDWNALYKLQGNTDIPLNDEGREMAAAAAEEYAGVHFDVCYSSPLVRARETAEILLAGRDIPICYDERLREVSFGAYEGTERVFEHPESPVYKFFKDMENYEAPAGAESFEELLGRAQSFLDERVLPFLGSENEPDILVVGHGALNSAMITCARGLPLKDFWNEGIPNCRLIRVL